MDNNQNPNVPGNPNGQNAPYNSGDVYSQRYAHQNADGSDFSKPQYEPQKSESENNAANIPGANGANAYVPEPFFSPAPTPAPAPAAGANAASAQKTSSGKTFLLGFAGALVACVLAFGLTAAFNPFGYSTPFGSNVTLGSTNGKVVTAAAEDATLAEAVAEKCLPSVVSISVLGQQQQQGGTIYDFLYGNGGNNNSGELQQVSMGSGVILSEDGYIITNYHVISTGQQYEVTIEGDKYEAELVGSDSSSDVAVLKVKDGKGFTAIELGDSDNITIGEWVMSIGSPFGLEQSVATGIVSATSRSQIMDSSQDMFGNSNGETTVYPNMIQTDAAINPGNSGGALVDENGQLIGINTLITSYSGNYSGVGFAIPANYAINLAQSIIAGKEPTRAQLGITMTTINKSIASRYGFSTNEGAYVSSVASGSAAEKAGIKVGDIITKMNDKNIGSASDVMLEVRTHQPNDKISVTVNRDGQEQTMEVTLGQSEGKTIATPQTQQNSNSNSPFGFGLGNNNRNNSNGNSNS